MKILSFLLAFIFLMSFSSALTVSPNNFNINKTYNSNLQVTFTIQNNHAFDMYNISSSNLNIIDFTQFDLASGENKTIQADVKATSEFNGTIKIQGEYQTNIGQSNQTHNLSISSSYDNYIDQCNLEIIEGDSVTWKNNVQGVVQLKNFDTSETIAEIDPDSSYTETFSSSEVLKYQIFRIGIAFSPVCEINVLDDSGLVHSNQYDADLDLNIKINYPQTVIETTFLQTSYNIQFNGQVSDIFSIKNIGSEPARNVKLSGDWFTFDKNNFNIPAGGSINVGYTINPLILLTNHTNATHIKPITIEGNFDTLRDEISIFIPYRKLSNDLGDITADKTLLDNFVKNYCLQNPDVCPQEQIILGGGNGTFTIEFTEESWKSFLESQIAYQDNDLVWKKNLSEVVAQQGSALKDLNVSQAKANENEEKLITSVDDTNALSWFFVIVLIIVFLAFLSIIWLKGNKLDRILDKFRFKKEILP